MPRLSPPTIVVPLSVCSNRIHLQTQKTGADVTITVQSTSWAGGNFVFRATSSDEVFALPHALAPGDRVSTFQDMPGYGSSADILCTETVPPAPDPNEVQVPTAMTHLHACGGRVAIGNVFPGATVTITSTTRGRDLGTDYAESDGCMARITLAEPLLAGEDLTCRQEICGHVRTGPLPRPDRAQNVHGTIPAPTILEPLIECDSEVHLEGLLEGSTASLHVDADIYDYSVDFPKARAIVPPLRSGGRVSVEQMFPAPCELHSPLVPNPGVLVAPMTALPSPWIGPVCRGSENVIVGGLRKGSTVVILLNGNEEIGGGEAWADICTFKVAPLLNDVPEDAGEMQITAQQTRCGHQSARGLGTVVQPGLHGLPALRLPEPLFEGATVVRVEGCHPGAELTLYMSTAAGTRQISADNRFPLSDIVDVAVAPGLVAGRDVWAEQVGCNARGISPRQNVHAVGDLRPPTIRNCGDHVSVTDATPGYRTEIYVTGSAYIAGSTSGSSAFSMWAPADLPQGASVSARTVGAGKTSGFSAPIAIDHDLDNARLSLIDTQWVAQITGGHDNLGRPTLNQTCSAEADAPNTDLGISVEHFFDGEWRNYIFFGDTGSKRHYEKESPDAIAWTTDLRPSSRGFRLNFVEQGGPAAPDNKWFRRLSVPGVSLKEFEVPSGAFSHNGKLYVFLTTDFFVEDVNGHPTPIKDITNDGDHHVMGSSLLAVGADPGNDFTKLHEISKYADRGAGGFKFINISPEKVRNVDLPGLPDNATASADGLLMVGSGQYCGGYGHQSWPYLAYVPLPNGADPQRNDWRFLSGYTPGVPGYGPLGKPTWSTHESDAAPLFQDYGNFGELSLSWNPGLRRWLLLYGGAGTCMKSARWPWGPWSPTPHLQVFDMGRDNTSGFIKRDPDPGSTYGPYVIRRFSEWEPLTQRATIYYLMSTFRPYQVSLIKSTVRLECP